MAVGSFAVTDGKAFKVSGLVGRASVVLAGRVLVEVGGGLSGTDENKCNWLYQAAPGIVFADRLDVIWPKGKGNAEGEVFSDMTAFLTGEVGEDDDDDEVEEMELMAVDAETARNDLDIDPAYLVTSRSLRRGMRSLMQ